MEQQVQVEPQWFLREAQKFQSEVRENEARRSQAHQAHAAACAELAAAAAKVEAARRVLAEIPEDASRRARQGELCAQALVHAHGRLLAAKEAKDKGAAKTAQARQRAAEHKTQLLELLERERSQGLQLLEKDAELRMAHASLQEKQEALDAKRRELEQLYKGFGRTRANSSCKDLVLEIQSLKKGELLREVAQRFRELGQDALAAHYETMDAAWHERHLSPEAMTRATGQTLTYMDLENVKHGRNLQRVGKHATDAPDECLTADGDARVAPDLKRRKRGREDQ